MGRWEQRYGAEGRGDGEQPAQHRQQRVCNDCAPGGSFTAPTHVCNPSLLASVNTLASISVEFVKQTTYYDIHAASQCRQESFLVTTTAGDPELHTAAQAPHHHILRSSRAIQLITRRIRTAVLCQKSFLILLQPA